MRHRRRTRAATAAFLAVVGPAIVTGCSGSSGDAGHDAGGDAPTASPYGVTFELNNDGVAPVYLFEGCVLDFSVTSIADPSRVIGRGGDCACSCDDASCTGNVTCGACFDGSIAVAAADTYENVWQSVDISYQPRAGFSCADVVALTAGSYRVDVPVYGSPDDAAAQTNAQHATATFQLPPLGPVVVPLAPSS